MAKARDAVEAAKSNGLTRAKVIEAAGHWEAKLKTTHGVGAFFDWIREATANQAVDDARFWPASKPQPGEPSREMRAGMPIERYRKLLEEIRRLGSQATSDLSDAVGIDQQKIKDRGLDSLSSDERDRLVREYAKRLNADRE